MQTLRQSYYNKGKGSENFFWTTSAEDALKNEVFLQKKNEIGYHLGNVRAVVSDLKESTIIAGIPSDFEPDIVATNSFYAFGSLMPNRSFSSNEYRYGFNGKEMDNEIKNVTGSSYDFGGRNIYDPRLGRYVSVDPWTDKYAWQTPYAYHRNSPISKIDWNGYGDEGDDWLDGLQLGLDVAGLIPGVGIVPDLINAGISAGRGDYEGAALNLAAAVPVVGIGVGVAKLGYKTVKTTTKIVKATTKTTEKVVAKTAKTVSKKTTTSTTKKTYQTYTKTNSKTGEVYTGRTSGTNTPQKNVAKRDASHHMKSEDGWEPAKLDKSSTNSNAIRGREQEVIDASGGAKSEGGTSGNAIRGVSKQNPKAKEYKRASGDEFGGG